MHQKEGQPLQKDSRELIFMDEVPSYKFLWQLMCLIQWTVIQLPCGHKDTYESWGDARNLLGYPFWEAAPNFPVHLVEEVGQKEDVPGKFKSLCFFKGSIREQE